MSCSRSVRSDSRPRIPGSTPACRDWRHRLHKTGSRPDSWHHSRSIRRSCLCSCEFHFNSSLRRRRPLAFEVCVVRSPKPSRLPDAAWFDAGRIANTRDVTGRKLASERPPGEVLRGTCSIPTEVGFDFFPGNVRAFFFHRGIKGSDVFGILQGIHHLFVTLGAHQNCRTRTTALKDPFTSGCQPPGSRLIPSNNEPFTYFPG